MTLTTIIETLEATTDSIAVHCQSSVGGNQILIEADKEALVELAIDLLKMANKPYFEGLHQHFDEMNLLEEASIPITVTRNDGLGKTYMPTGLVALLDDVAAIAKVAAASLDDIGAAAARAGTKSAGVVIDDAAVTPQYVTGFDPSRELPMIWKIAKGSIKNKLLFLLPAAVLLGQFAPFLIPFILILGGLFLCYEAAEKVLEWLHVDETTKHDEPAIIEGKGREEEMTAGAIRTDFILSAEIMAIALSEVTDEVWWQQGIILALIGIVITVGVYGAVALIVKMDDVGLHLATENEGALASFGRGLVAFMPKLLTGISIIGTLAMAWVGGGLLVHNIAAVGWHGPEHLIGMVSNPLVGLFPEGTQIFASGISFAVLSGLMGVVIGAVIAPLVHKVIPHGEAH